MKLNETNETNEAKAEQSETPILKYKSKKLKVFPRISTPYDLYCYIFRFIKRER
jgi:hypothetical protein